MRRLAVLALLLTACGAQPVQQAASTSLTWAIETQPITLNPHQWAPEQGPAAGVEQLRRAADHDAEGGSFQPWLATSWEVSDDGLTYTFELRDDVTFHDGTTFDAAAVKANLDQLREPGYNPAVAAIQLSDLQQGRGGVDPPRSKITLKEPDVLFLDFLASPQGAQVSPKSLREAKDLKAGGADVVGTGPFILDRYVQGQEVHYRRNPAYDVGARRAPATRVRRTSPRSPTGSCQSPRSASARSPPARCRSSRACPPPSSPDQQRPRPDAEPRAQLRHRLLLLLQHLRTRPSTTSGSGRRSGRPSTSTPCSRLVYRGTATRAWSVVGQSSPFYDASLEKTYGGDPARANAPARRGRLETSATARASGSRPASGSPCGSCPPRRTSGTAATSSPRPSRPR